MLIELYFFSIGNNIECEFQYEILMSYAGCALEQSAERDGYDFNCVMYDENCEICDYSYSYLYTKYILDFSLKKGTVKVDLELDGIKFHENKKEYDCERDNFMKNKGWIVLRFDSSVVLKNKSKIFKDLKKVFCLQDFDLNIYKGKEHDNKLLF